MWWVRPGRFDRLVVLDRPDLKERDGILRVHARKLRTSPSVKLETVVADTPGMVGADLANIVHEAALNAARRNADQIEMVDFERAVDRVTLGFEKRGRLISPEEKERVAYHEVGHALVALSVPNGDPVLAAFPSSRDRSARSGTRCNCLRGIGICLPNRSSTTTSQ